MERVDHQTRVDVWQRFPHACSAVCTEVTRQQLYICFVSDTEDAFCGHGGVEGSPRGAGAGARACASRVEERHGRVEAMARDGRAVWRGARGGVSWR